MNIITKECEDCSNLQEVLSYIECTLLDLAKKKYSSLAYGVKTCFSQELFNDLSYWKRIVEARIYNCSYPCSEFSSNDILAKARILAYNIDCSRCPECEEVIVPTTTTTFPPDESRCVSYLVEGIEPTGDSVQYPYSYINCSGNFISGSISQYQGLNICAIENSVFINTSVFSITQYADECSIVPEACICVLLTNEETEEGVAPYKFSYEDCADNIFTDIPLDFQESTNICVRPSTFFNNFAFSMINNGPCIEDCPTTTTTTP